MNSNFSSDILKNKNILITGATRGIGLELALTTARYGANTILIGKNKKKLEKIYDQIVEQNLPEPSIVPLNLAGATPKDYQELTHNIAVEYGQLDGLVHNAATIGIKTEIIHYDILKWYEALQVNLNAPFLITKFLLPLLKLSKQASIIFTTANEAIKGQPYQGAYGVSKAAIKNFMEILAAECEDYTNLRINAVNPNKVYSGIYTQNYPGTYPDNMPSTKDIMPIYLYLLSDFSKKIHGQTIDFNADINLDLDTVA